MEQPSPTMEPSASLRAAYFRSEHEAPSPLPPRLQLETKLNFQYRGDLFGQHGVYSDASLYMSRLPSSRKSSILRPKAGTAYRAQGIKLAPMQSLRLPPQQQPQRQGTSGATKPNKVSRKRQYALAVEAMASNAALRDSLVGDNVIPSILSLMRTKDAATVASCVATLSFLSIDPLGREAILNNSSALPLLAGLANALSSLSCGQTLLHNFLGMLANLTIQDSFEGAIVHEKVLDSMFRHRKATPLSERMCVLTVLNLSCPALSYPRVEDVARAIHDLSRDQSLSFDHRATLSRSLYNLSCTRVNQPKLVDGDAVATLRMLLSSPAASDVNSDDEDGTLRSIHLNALMTAWHLAENSQCRRALTRADFVRALVDVLRSDHRASDDQLRSVLLVLLSLATDELARQRLGDASLLDILAQLITAVDDGFSSSSCDSAVVVAVMYRLLALVLSAPVTVEDVKPSFLAFLLSFHHDSASLGPSCSRYVLFSLACILWWNGSGESDGHARNHLDNMLNDPVYLDPLLTHVDFAGFADDDAPEVLLQTLLLYNLSFRYNKTDVAKRVAPRLRALVLASTDAAILGVLCGTLWCLCQEFATHCELHAAGVLETLPLLLQRCNNDQSAQATCLDVVCVVFDGRMLPRSDLAALLTLVAPALVALCENGPRPLRASCAACFARFAAIDECRAALARHGVIRALAVLANEEDAQTLRLCVSAYSHLSRDALICAQLIASGIIKSLTFLAAAPEEAVRRACAMALCNLSTAEDNIGVLANAGALKALLVISCVKSNDPETRRICMKAVMNLLRLPANIPLLCQDGLIWAFGLFAGGMEPKDFDILCDAFCALAFYPTTRKGVAKPTILAAMFQVFDSAAASLTAQLRLLKGISNLLCDLPNAAHLLQAGVLSHLMAITERSSDTDGETRMLVAQILVLLFPSCPDAESEFVEPRMLRTVQSLVRTDHEDCGRCCSVLLFQMSQHAATRAALVRQDASSSIVSALTRLFLSVSHDSRALLIRVLFIVSSDATTRHQLNADHVVACVAAVVPKKVSSLVVDAAAFCAGLMRNLSCEAAAHAPLMDEQVTSLLQKLFDVDDDACKEDAAVCICNVFMGRVNTTSLLARGVLPMVLWLCSARAALAIRVLGTTVVRRLALSPGNAQVLIDGGVISHLALLMQDCSSLFIKTNCIATFCLVSHTSGVPALLASYGVIGSVLVLLLDAGGARDALFEAMCVDLLSTLAEFTRADDPTEARLASILYQLIEGEESASQPTLSTDSPVSPASPSAWQTDRSFLQRDAQSPLAPPTPSRAHERVSTKPPTLRHTLYPVHFAGHSVDFTLMASTTELRTKEPIFPSLMIIGEKPEEAADCTAVATTLMTAHTGLPPSRLSFSPPPMFPKNRTPFAATVSTQQLQP